MFDVAEPELTGCCRPRAAAVEFVALDVVKQMTALTEGGDVRGISAFATGELFAFANVANSVQMGDREHYFRAGNRVRLVIFSKTFFAAVIGALKSDVFGKLFPIWRIARIIHKFN